MSSDRARGERRQGGVMAKGKEEKEEGPQEITEGLADSPGYLLFSAQLTPIRDANGKTGIVFKYRRYHFALEDAKQAIKELKKFVDSEVKKLYEEHDQEYGGE